MSDPTNPSISPAPGGTSPLASDRRPSEAPAQTPVDPAASVEATPKPYCLTPKQAKMLQELADGLSITDVAQIVGVSRNTVYRWLRDDPVVRAAYNKWKLSCEESARARLVALQETAVDVLSEELETKRSPKIAALLLDKMGVLTKPQSGSTDARRTAAEIELDRREHAAGLYDRSERLCYKELLTGNDRIWPIEALKAPKKE